MYTKPAVLIAILCGLAIFAQGFPTSLDNTAQDSSAGLAIQAENSPVRNHLADTILGPRERLSLGDAKLDATLGSVTDFIFLSDDDLLVADASANLVYRAGPDGLMRIFAGNGARLHSGDGGKAVEAGIPAPISLVAAASGEVYVGQIDGRIRRISLHGMVETVAGTGEPGCPVQGALAVSSAMNPIMSMALDRDRILYMALNNCHAIYRIDSEGRVQIVAGLAGGPVPQGTNVFFAKSRAFELARDLNVTSSGDVLFSALQGTSRAYFRVTPSGIAEIIGLVGGLSSIREGDSSDVRLTGVESFALRDDGSMLVASTRGSQFSASGYELGVIGTDGVYSIIFTRDGFGGKPRGEINGAFASPFRLRLDPNGRPHFLDRFHRSILRVQADGTIQPVVGRFDPPTVVDAGGVQAQFGTLLRLAVDLQNRIYFHTSRIFRLNLDGTVTHIAGDGTAGGSVDGVPAVSTGIDGPRDFAMDAAGNLYTSETTFREGRPTAVIRKVGTDGIIRIVAGGGSTGVELEGIPATNANLDSAIDRMAVSANGEVYFTERLFSASARVWRRKLDGTLTRVYGPAGSGPGVPPAAGVPAKEAGGLAIEALLPQPDGSLILHLGPFSVDGVFRIDNQGLLQPVVNRHQNNQFLDGGPTISAPSYFSTRAVAAGAGRFLATISSAGLAEYVDGGNVRLWDSFSEGVYRSDGDTMARDMNYEFSGVQPLSDGSIVWLEQLWPDTVIRRSIVVPAGCVYSANTPFINAPAAGSTMDISLSTGPGCPWVMGSTSHWVHWEGAPRGSGPVTVQLTMTANPSPNARSASFTIAGQRIPIEQAGNAASPLFAVSPRKVTLGPSEDAVKLELFTGPSVNWQIVLPAGLSLDGALTGSGSGSRVVRVPANQTGVSRVFSVLVNGLAVEIVQAAPALMAPVTITGNDLDAKVFVDLEERTLPYTTQWVAGSSHHLFGREFERLGEASLRQFQGWGSSSQQELIVTAPAGPAAFHAVHRRLHGLSLVSQTETSPHFNPAVAFQFPAIAVPDSILMQLQMPRTSYYVEGESLPVLGVGEMNIGFLRWRISPSGSGGQAQTEERTENPTTIIIHGPTQLTAIFRFDGEVSGPLLAGRAAPLRFQERVSAVNPICVTVATKDPQVSPPLSGLFFSNSFAPLRGVNWMQARVTNQGRPPFVLELKPDTQDPLFAQTSAFSARGAVYLLTAGGKPEPVHYSLGVVSRPQGNAPNIIAVTDAGGFRQGAGEEGLPIASDSIVTIFGENLAASTQQAATVPLPLALADASVDYFDNLTNQWQPLPLFFVSPLQINFHVPEQVAAGFVSSRIPLRVRSGVSSSPVVHSQISTASASLFTADSSGLGAPAGSYVRVRQNGVQERGDLFLCQSGACTPKPAPRGSGNRLFLELYGSGFSNVGEGDVMVLLGDRHLQPTFAGPNRDFIGLSQLNVEVPADLPSGADLDLYLWVRPHPGERWVSSNRVSIRLE